MLTCTMAPVSSIISCINSLEENPREIFLEVTSILLELANNVITHPTNPKYRSVRLANPRIAKTLVPAIGAMECLFEMGFEEADDSLVLCEKNSLHNITLARDEILRRRKIMLGALPAAPPARTPKLAMPQPSTSVNLPSVSSNTKPTAKTHDSFALDMIPRYSGLVLQYETDSIKKEALACVPLMQLESNAVQRLRDAQIALKSMRGCEKLNEPSLQIMLILELMNWFKNSFFNWVDTLPCFACSKETESLRRDSINGLSIDVFRCKSCHQETLFPRYNDPRKLLETRRGRCGEWANCFTLLCRSFGWDARLVVDATDHVWTEVFIADWDRWVHCDPCEDAFDQPLMYELGWNKDLSYIIAFSCDDVQDVSWRYSTRHAEMRKRRNSCTESDLLNLIIEVRQNLQEKVSPARKSYLQRRTLKELVELMKEPTGEASNYSGRQSGSLEWRLARGEVLGSKFSGPYVWKPNALEVRKRCIHIQYCTGTDSYKRPEGGDVILKGWQNGAFAVDSIFMKEEKDWKMLYLARTEGSHKGHIEWKVDLEGTGLVVDSISIILNKFTCESGRAMAVICGDHSCLFVGESELSTNDLSGEQTVTVKVDLEGGVGSVAWQHAQILRAPSNSENITLDIKVRLKSGH